MDRRQTRGLIALFAVLNIFCWYIFTRPTSLWLAEQGLQSEAPPPPEKQNNTKTITNNQRAVCHRPWCHRPSSQI